MEFQDCAYQHDPLVLLAHETFKNQNKTEEEKAELIRQLLPKDTTEEDEIISRCMMLKHWPEYPTEEALLRAQELIHQYKVKIRYQ